MMKRLLMAVAAFVLAGGLVWALRAETVRPDVIGLFPKDVSEFAYADLKAARKFSWYAQLKEQMLPSRFRQFEQFLISAGIDPERQVNELVWAAIFPTAETGEQVVGVALGQFNPATTEEFFKAQKLPTAKFRGYTLFAYGSGVGPGDIFFFFLDANTAAFGHRAIVERLIEVRYGAEESLLRNEQMFPLIEETNGRGVAWAVLNRDYTRLGIQQLVPEAAQFPDSGRLLSRLRALTLRIEADGDVETRFQAVCETPEDANVFANLMQAGLVYRSYIEKERNPDLAKMLEEVRVTPRGDRLEVQIKLTEESLLALLKRGTFSVKI
jgi:hypothetical protein